MKKYLSAERLVPIGFFLGVLVLGLCLYQDYGLAWDEPSARFRGILNFQYVFGDNQELLSNELRYYGPAFELVLIFVEIASGLRSLREIYFLRHLATFLTFYLSVICFYRLCAARFENWRIGLTGALFYVVSPRIFAHAFYNSKDAAFLAVFVICIYTMMRYLEQQTLWRAFVHAALCGFLIDIRIPGGLVPFLTYVFVLGDLVSARASSAQMMRKILFLLIYTVFTINVVILCFPMLWENPIREFLQAFTQMKQYPWVGTMLYFGRYFTAPDLPWHYTPVWIAMTTPWLYLAGFVIGAPVGLYHLLKDRLEMFRRPRKRYELLFWLWGIGSLTLILGTGTVVYDGWRHLFFVYPGLLGVALHGLVLGKQAFDRHVAAGLRKLRPWVTAGVIAAGLAGPIWFMIRYHPYQNLYFNRLAGPDMPTIKQRFDLDYWGLSYRAALEYIVKTDPRPQIRLNDPNLWAAHRLHILSDADRARIVLVDAVEEADYFISNYRWHPDDYAYAHEVFSVNIRGAKIMIVYAFP